MPDKFEDAIQLTEVKKQDIQKALAEKNKTEVEFETKKLEALYQMNVTAVFFTFWIQKCLLVILELG